MKRLKGYGLVLSSALIFTASCSKEETSVYSTPDDQILEQQILTLYGSMDSLLLPASNAYSEIPNDPKNPLTREKILLGKLLFHETGLGLNPTKEEGRGTYSCASCHHAKAGFQSGIKQGIGEGGIGFGLNGEGRRIANSYEPSQIDVQPLRSPTILNSAFQKVMLWNGQFGATGPNVGTEAQWTVDTPKETNELGFEGVEIQAIAGMGVHRLKIDSVIISELGYRTMFDSAFGDVAQNERYTLLNASLAIAAFERTVMPNAAPFQWWLRGDKEAMSEQETKGAQLFFGKANCYNCHSGPALNAMEFHALGMNDLAGEDIQGEVDLATKKGRGGFTKNPADDYAFKTPTIYNLKDVDFLGHGGSFSSVREIINYKNSAIAENKDVAENQLSPSFKPLNLTSEEIEQLTAFIDNALYDNRLERYTPGSLPSDNCFPNADVESKLDMGCD